MIILEGQPDERRLIQTVDVGSEQNEVVVLRTGRFLFMFSGAPASRYWRDPRAPWRPSRPLATSWSAPAGGRTPSLARFHRARVDSKKKSPARPRGGAGVNSQRGGRRAGVGPNQAG